MAKLTKNLSNHFIKRFLFACAAILILFSLFIYFKNQSSWTTFTTDGTVSDQILNTKGMSIFGTGTSKLYLLKHNGSYKSFSLNTGNARYVGLWRGNVIMVSDDTIKSINIKRGSTNWQISTLNQTFYEKYKTLGSKILAGSADGALNAIRVSDGKLLWQFKVGNPENDIIHHFGNFSVYGNVAYLTSQSNNVYAINIKNGELLWNIKFDDKITTWPEINKGKYLLIGTLKKSTMVNAKTGKIVWQKETDSNVVCSMVSGGFINKKISHEFLGNGTIISRDANSGEIIQNSQIIDNISTCPVFWKSFAFVSSSDGNFALVSLKSHKIIYEKSNFGDPNFLPVLVSKFSGFIPDWLNIFPPDLFMVDMDGNIKKINAYSGKVKWTYVVEAPIVNNISFYKSKIYFSTVNGVIYKLNSKTGTTDINFNEKHFYISQEFKKTADTNILELTLKTNAKFSNPWTEANIYAIFIDENGREITIPGFYYDENIWKIRFNPPSKGNWSWKVYWLPHGHLLIKSGKFQSSTDTSDYFIRLSKKFPAKLTIDGKNIFNGLGLGNAMDDYNYNGTYHDDWGIGVGDSIPESSNRTTDDYISAYGPSGSGFNIYRWSVMNASQSLYVSLAFPTKYSVIQGKLGDDLVYKLKNNNIHIWFTMFGFDIPYKDSLNSTNSFLLKSYAKYVYARYGAYIDIWELANEISIPHDTANYLIGEIKNMDYENRAVSVSSSEYNFDSSEIVAPHWYETEPLSASDIKTVNQINKYTYLNKPIVFAEQGNQSVNYDDTSGLRMRVRAWTAFFNNAILMFWNKSDTKDYKSGIFPANLYIGEEERKYTSILQNLTAAFPLESQQIKYTFSDPAIRGYGLLSDKINGIYFYHYSSPFIPTKFSFTISTTSGGNAKWVDPGTGKILKNATCLPGNCNLESPVFTTDTALFITKNTK